MRVLVSRLSLSETRDNRIGGAEKAAMNLCGTLASLGHQPVLLANYRAAGAQYKVLHAPSAYSRYFRRIRYVLTLPVLFFYLLFVALIKRPDIINPQSREDQIIFTLLKPIHRTPVVWKDAGDLRHYVKPKAGLGRIIQKLLVKAIAKADAIYTVTDSDRNNIISSLKDLGVMGLKTQIKVIPSDILFDDYDLDAAPPKKTDKLVVGTVSRLEEHKGVQYLLAAAKQLKSSSADVELWIVGDGPYRSELETMAEGLDVTFWGYQEDVSPYLSGTDIFVQPAEQEGWGRTVKEAMYFGKAIVGSNVGGIAAQIEDGKNGLLFEPKNVDALKGHLERLVEDRKLRDRLGRAARKSALEKGDYRDLVKNRILPLFESVLQNTKKR